ncbi:MAG: hypothetical protein ACQCN6_14785 [Candidatus Bathyarchaeia archaeon]
MRRSVAAVVIIVIIVVAGFAVYLGLTYPRTTVDIPVSFSAGIDSQTASFDQPFLDDKAQITVSVHSGVAVWQAQILSGDQVVWEHTSAQSGQQSFTSDWIDLSSGNYNLTFRLIGAGSLDATVTVTSKGGFW